MLNSKRRLKLGTKARVISAPEGFKKGLSATNLLLEMGIPTLRGGHQAISGVPSRSESAQDDKVSVTSLEAFAKGFKLPKSTNTVATLLTHRYTASPKTSKGSLPNPLRSNPPEPTRKAPTPLVFKLDGCSPKASQSNAGHGGRQSASSTGPGSKPFRHSVTRANESFEASLPFFPITEQVEEILLPGMKSSSRPASRINGRRPQGKVTNSTLPRSSPQSIHGSLPLEMREPSKIWMKYAKTGMIDVEICSEALDGNGNYTWMHCWGLFNVYTFGASFVNDTEFADRVMDLLCEKIKPGKVADIDTICLIFTSENISSLLKRLVVDRCIDGGTNNLHRNLIRGLPHEFSVYALEAAVDRLTHCESIEKLQSRCRYHRHRRPQDCYLRKCFNERDRRLVAKKGARRNRTVTEASCDLETVNFKPSALASVSVDEAEDYKPMMADEKRKPDQTRLKSSAPETIPSVLESEMDTNGTSVVTLELENEGVLTAKSCRLFKPAEGAAVISLPCKSLPELGENILQVSQMEQTDQHPAPLRYWPKLSQATAFEDFLPSGSCPN